MREAILQRAVVLVKPFEGFSPTPYLCPAGYWTIGYGHLCTADHPTITPEQGEIWLRADLAKTLDAVLRLFPYMLQYPNRAVALTSWTFNLGARALATSTMRKRLEENDLSAAAKEMRRWNKITRNGKKVPLAGLTRRREAEARLLLEE